jgi:hypothetical protein
MQNVVPFELKEELDDHIEDLGVFDQSRDLFDVDFEGKIHEFYDFIAFLPQN